MADNGAPMTVSGALAAAAAHHAAGRLDDAQQLCDAVLETLPDHAEALHRRGVLAFQRGALGHAADLLRRAVVADPSAPETLHSLGNILLAGDDHLGAIECYGRSLSLGGDDPAVRIHLGIALHGAGRHPEAADTLTAGLAAVPDHAQGRAALAAIALDMGDEAEARTQLRAAAFLDERFAYGTSCVLGDDLEAYTSTDGLDEMLAAAPALEGETPSPDRKGLVVVTACDPAYFRRFAKPLAASLDANAPGADLHIHVFNPEADLDGEADRLRSSLRATTLTVSRESWPGADRLYFSNMRLVRLHQIQSRCRRDLLSLDTDSLVMAPLGGLDAVVDNADIAVTLRPHKAEIGQKILATTLMLRATPMTCEYLRRIASYILNCFHEDRLAWYLDQSVLYLVLRMMTASGEAPSVVALPGGYADSGFDPASPIWAAKGDGKTAPAFIAEAARHAMPIGGGAIRRAG